jgi:ubiquinone/menaquinone biosynthesis C-methylase UbiE
MLPGIGPDTPSARVWAKYDVGRIPSTTSVAVDILKDLPAPENVLALGCGTGRCLSAVAAVGGSSLVGLDVNSDAIDRARTEWRTGPKPTFVISDANKIPFGDDTFDLVVAQAFFTVIPRLAERTDIVGEVRRVLRPGSFFYVGDFMQDRRAPSYLSRYKRGFEMTGEYGTFPVQASDGQTLYFAHHFARGELETLLEGEGFQITSSRRVPAVTASGHHMQGLALVAQSKL